MRLRVAILDWPNAPEPVSFIMPIAAARFGAECQYVFSRITGRSLRYDFPAKAPVITPSFPVRDILETGVRNSADAWWDARRAIIEYTQNPNAMVDDVWLIWHNAKPGDVTGIAQPAWLPHREVRWDGLADPSIGGLATNGRAQLTYGITEQFNGYRYRLQVAYAAHELGHALGRHHTDRAPASPENLGRSLMAYGYSNLAGGLAFRGEYFNPKLATPEEITTWRAHSAFEDIEDRADSDTAGWADDVTVVRLQDARWLQKVAAGDTPPNQRSEAVARVTWGALQSDL